MDKKEQKKVENDNQTNNCQAFAKMIRELREQAGYSIEQIAQTTRIAMPFIQALENGNLAKLPGVVFGRGFIRNICKAFNTDPTPFIEAYENALQEMQINDDMGLRVPVKDSVSLVQLRSEQLTGLAMLKSFLKTYSPRHYFESVPLMIISIVVAFVLLIPFFVYLSDIDKGQIAQITSRPSDGTITAADTQEQTTPQKNEMQPQEAAGNDGKSVQQAEALEFNTSDTQVLKGNALPNEQTLEVVVKEQVRLRLSIDDGNWSTLDLQPKTYLYTFKKKAQLLVFDASAIEINFNGKPLGNLGTKGRIRRLSFVAEHLNLNKNQKM